MQAPGGCIGEYGTGFLSWRSINAMQQMILGLHDICSRRFSDL